MKKLLALIFALSLTLSLVACGGNKETPTETPDSPKTEDESSTPAAAGGYREWVWIGTDAELDSADPHNRTGSQSEQLTTLTFDTVTYLDTDTGEVMPELAREWEASADNIEWTFYLEEGVTFHNGNPFTADDVKFTWEYAGSNQGNVIKPISAYDYVEEIVVVDEHTVKFVLKSGMPDFATYLETKIYDKEAFDELPAEEAGVIGTGPYFFDTDQRILGQQFVATRYEDYWRGTDDYATKHIGYRIIPDANALINALQTGQIDMIGSAVAFSNLAAIEADPNLVAHTRSGAMIYHLAFNHTNPILSDLNVRKAICQAVNKEDIEMIFWEGGAGGFAHDNYCPPTGLGYSDSIDTLGYDPDAARAVLEPMNLSMDLAVYPANQKLGEVLQACLEDVGMDITLTIVPDGWDAFKRAGEFELYAEYGSYQGALLYNFTRFFATGAASNPYKYSSEEFERLLADCREAATWEDMLAKFEVLQQFVADDIPSFPLGVSNLLVPANKNVEGIKMAPTVNWHDFSQVRIPNA